MFHKSPIQPVSAESPKPAGGLRNHLALLPERLGRHILGTGHFEKSVPPEPVDEEILSLARFVVSKCDMGRLDYISVSAAAQANARLDKPEQVIEYKHADRYKKGISSWERPTTVLTLIGADYCGKTNANDFYCELGLYPLSSGLSVVQATPYEWDAPSQKYEYGAMRQSLEELFGGHPENNRKAMEEYARINFAVIDGEGKAEELRPFNVHAFGSDFLAILKEATHQASTQGTDIFIDIQDGMVTDLLSADTVQT